MTIWCLYRLHQDGKTNSSGADIKQYAVGFSVEQCHQLKLSDSVQFSQSIHPSFFLEGFIDAMDNKIFLNNSEWKWNLLLWLFASYFIFSIMWYTVTLL